MLDDRPDRAATAETLKTIQFFVVEVNTWYGACSSSEALWCDDPVQVRVGRREAWSLTVSSESSPIDVRLGVSLESAFGERVEESKVSSLIADMFSGTKMNDTPSLVSADGV